MPVGAGNVVVGVAVAAGGAGGGVVGGADNGGGGTVDVLTAASGWPAKVTTA